jgi:phosphoadenosine phosphosulfate reductase
MVQIQEATRTDRLLRALKAAAGDHGPAALSIAGTPEDEVIAHASLSAGIAIEIFAEPAIAASPAGAALIERIRRRHGYEVRIYTPEIAAAQNTDWYGFGVADPLKLALLGKGAWITGLRQDASSRHTVPAYEYDALHGVLKFNPLAQWSDRDVHEYLCDHALETGRPAPAAETVINRIAA